MSSVTLNGQTFDSDDWDAAGYLHPTTGWFAHLSALLAEIGKGTFDVSTSSNDIGTGEKTWTLTNKRPVTVGSWVVVAEAGTPTNFCAGPVTAYNTSTGALTVDVAVTGGSGTGVASWTVIHGGAYEPADATILKEADIGATVVGPGATSNLTAGFTTDEEDLGTVTGGTVTLDFTKESVKTLTANGAFTLAPPASGTGSCEIWVTNGASAGAITTSGFTKVIGSYATTNAKKYLFQVKRSSVGSILSIVEIS
jgi:hypothetical protein